MTTWARFSVLWPVANKCNLDSRRLRGLFMQLPKADLIAVWAFGCVLSAILATATACSPLCCQPFFLRLRPKESSVFKFAQNPSMLNRSSESVYQTLWVLTIARCDVGHANLQSLPDNLLWVIYHRLNFQSTSLLLFQVYSYNPDA